MSDPILLTHLDYTERKIALSAVAPTTKRYIMYHIGVNTERGIMQHYVLTRWTDRRLIYIRPFFASERKVAIPQTILSLATSRFCAIAPPDPCLYERYCTFIPGAQRFTWTGSIRLAFKYIQERRVYVEQDPIDLRLITFPITISDERLAWLQCAGDSRVFSPIIHTSIRSSSDRSIYIELLDKMTQRRIGILLLVPDERLLWLQTDRLAQIYTPVVKTTIARLFSDRWCATSSLQLYDERLCHLLHHPTTERLISLVYTGFDERQIVVSILESTKAFTFYVEIATPVPTERMVTYVPIVYYSERCIWPETRDIHQVRMPTRTADPRIIRSLSDDTTQFLLKNDRDMESSGLGSHAKLQEVDKVTLNVNADFDSITVSMVDNLGASITQDPSQAKPITHLATAVFKLGLIVPSSRTERLAVYSSMITYSSDRLFVTKGKLPNT